MVVEQSLKFSLSPPGTAFPRRNRSAAWPEFADQDMSQQGQL